MLFFELGQLSFQSPSRQLRHGKASERVGKLSGRPLCSIPKLGGKVDSHLYLFRRAGSSGLIRNRRGLRDALFFLDRVLPHGRHHLRSSITHADDGARFEFPDHCRQVIGRYGAGVRSFLWQGFSRASIRTPGPTGDSLQLPCWPERTRRSFFGNRPIRPPSHFLERRRCRHSR